MHEGYGSRGNTTEYDHTRRIMNLRLLTIILLGCLLLGCTGSEQPTAPSRERDEFDRFEIPAGPWLPDPFLPNDSGLYTPPDSIVPYPGCSDSTIHPARPDSGWIPDYFVGDTLITFRLREEGLTTVIVKSREGNTVDTVLAEYLEEGEYAIYWDGVLSDGTLAPPGVYFYGVRQENILGRGMFLRYP